MIINDMPDRSLYFFLNSNILRYFFRIPYCTSTWCFCKEMLGSPIDPKFISCYIPASLQLSSTIPQYPYVPLQFIFWPVGPAILSRYPILLPYDPYIWSGLYLLHDDLVLGYISYHHIIFIYTYIIYIYYQLVQLFHLSHMIPIPYDCPFNFHVFHGPPRYRSLLHRPWLQASRAWRLHRG